jgi:hypothetical protein
MYTDTLDHLLVAAANPDKEFASANLSKELGAIASRPGVVTYVKRAAQIDRLRGWDVLSAAIRDPDSS